LSVQGKPILQYQLEALSDAGVRRCVIVVGYRAAQIRSYFGSHFRNLSITYVENEIFDRTNNIYSLWLARQEITEDLLLLEGDLVFETGLLLDVIKSPHKNAAVVDRFHSLMDGTVIFAQGERASAMVLKADQEQGFDYQSALKTVNIYKFSHHVLSGELMPTLSSYVAQGMTNMFYEMAISDAVAKGTIQLHILPTGARVWTEIDTEQDLAAAESMRFWPTPLHSSTTRAPAAY
jgi:choline kinase